MLKHRLLLLSFSSLLLLYTGLESWSSTVVPDPSSRVEGQTVLKHRLLLLSLSSSHSPACLPGATPLAAVVMTLTPGAAMISRTLKPRLLKRNLMTLIFSLLHSARLMSLVRWTGHATNVQSLSQSSTTPVLCPDYLASPPPTHPIYNPDLGRDVMM